MCVRGFGDLDVTEPCPLRSSLQECCKRETLKEQKVKKVKQKVKLITKQEKFQLSCFLMGVDESGTVRVAWWMKSQARRPEMIYELVDWFHPPVGAGVPEAELLQSPAL